ncbi:hypothetical protein [Lentzea indica]|uniref:hypothetical protein n=1 Tax=Lentzea indica TaxID=2604800 RepID=UPI00143C741F
MRLVPSARMITSPARSSSGRIRLLTTTRPGVSSPPCRSSGLPGSPHAIDTNPEQSAR